YDARLLGRNQLDAIAEECLMIKRYRHDEAGGRVLNDIGGIEAPAEPHLPDSCAGWVVGEEPEHRRGQKFEDRDLLTSVGVGHTLQSFSQDSILDKSTPSRSAKAVALVPVDQMG